MKHSELMMKDKELLKLREDNSLLAKQFREKKEAQKKRAQLSQVIGNCIALWNNVFYRSK